MSHGLRNKLVAMLPLLYGAVHAGDNHEDVLDILYTLKYKDLSEEEKVQLLTELEPEDVVAYVEGESEKLMQSNNYGLLGYIMKQDRVRCFETILRILPLYCVYKDAATSQYRHVRETLYRNKVVYRPTSSLEIDEIAEGMRFEFEQEKVYCTATHSNGDLDVPFPRQEPLLLPASLFFQNVRRKCGRLPRELKVLYITGHGNLNGAAMQAIDTVISTLQGISKEKSPTFSLAEERTKAHTDSENLEKFCQALQVLSSALAARGTFSNEENQTNLCTLKKEAVLLLAAKMFVIISKYEALECAQFLLDAAPQFIHVEVNGKMAVDVALTSGVESYGQLVNMVVLRGVRVSNASVLGEFYTWTPTPVSGEYTRRLHQASPGTQSYTPTQDSTSEETRKNEAVQTVYGPDLLWLTKHIIRDNEESIKGYKDHHGNSLLHILIAQIGNTDNNTIYKCVKELLAAGINPTDRNNSHQSVLHVLFSSVRSSCTGAFFECAKLLVPYFKGVKMTDKNILENLAYILRSDGHWIEFYKSIMAYEVLDADFVVDSGYTLWQLLLRGFPCRPVDSDTFMNSPCRLCASLADMCRRDIERGCNIGTCVEAVVSNHYTVYDSSYKNQVPTVAGKTIFAVRFSYQNLDCCYLTLLKVLLCNGADIEPLVKLDAPNAKVVTWIRLISDPGSEYYGYRFLMSLQRALNATEMYKICKAFVLYYPACTINMVICLMASVQGAQDKVKALTHKLCNLLGSPRSLQFVLKRAIVKAVPRKQVDSLILPTALKSYIMEDEIEKDETD